jgi:hypothetical protein
MGMETAEKPRNTTKKKLLIGATCIFGGLLVIVVFSSGSPAPQTAQSAPPAAVVTQAAPEAVLQQTPAVAPQPAPTPVITHNYAMEQDGEYGYESGISEDDAKQGTVAKPLMMYRYLGKIHGAYTVETSGDGGAVARASCEDPCNFVKIRLIADGQVLKTETMANTDGSLISDRRRHERPA